MSSKPPIQRATVPSNKPAPGVNGAGWRGEVVTFVGMAVQGKGHLEVQVKGSNFPFGSTCLVP